MRPEEKLSGTCCPVHGPVLILDARAPKAGKPITSFFTAATRVAKRFEPTVAKAFLDSIAKLQGQIHESELRKALAGGDLRMIEAAAGVPTIGQLLENDPILAREFGKTLEASARTGAEILADYGLGSRFNASDPRAALFAQDQAGALIVEIQASVREAVRIVLGAAQEYGLTTVQQARAMREIVGLPPNWTSAPFRLVDEIQAGQAAAATSRRLSAAAKAEIRARIAAGTVDQAFLDRMRETYTQSLLNRRARNIARTETLRSAIEGQTLEWRQAAEEGLLPTSTRRVVLVTPDKRLREAHALVPGMNPKGVGLDEPFDTPWGPLMNPPWEPNCRCGTGLVFPGLTRRRA